MEKTPAAKKRRKRGALDDTPRYAANTLGGGSGVAKATSYRARKINDYGRRRKKAKKAIAARWSRLNEYWARRLGLGPDNCTALEQQLKRGVRRDLCHLPLRGGLGRRREARRLLHSVRPVGAIL